jgi:hypothetical protein
MAREGDNFEKFVLESWPLGGAAKLSKTKNSGAVHEDGDLASSEFQAECKEGYAEGVTVRREWINKLVRAAKLRGRMPLWFHRTLEGDDFAVIPMKDLFGILEELHEYRDAEREAHGR